MNDQSQMNLVWPSLTYLPGYVNALKQGWSPDNVRGEAAIREALDMIAFNPTGFIAEQID